MKRVQTVSILPKTGRRPEAAQDIVYRWLKQHVLTLPRHEATFLTEAEVSRETGTSRTPVREALKLLEAEGYVTGDSYRGACVAPFDASASEEVLNSAKTLSSESTRLREELDRFMANIRAA